MADVPEILTQQLVGDIVTAVRLELAAQIPVLLEPLVEELRDWKIHSGRDQGRDRIHTPPSLATFLSDRAFPSPGDPSFRSCSREFPAAAAAAARAAAAAAAADCAAAADELAIAPSSYTDFELEDHHREDCRRATAEGQLMITEPAALMIDPLPMDMEIEMSMPLVTVDPAGAREVEIEMSKPLVDPAGPPEECTRHREGLLRWIWRHLCGQHRSSARGGYRLSSQTETADETITDSNHARILEDEGPELTDPVEAKRLRQEIARIRAQAASIGEYLDDLDALWKNRRKPYEEDVANGHKEIEKLQEDLEIATMPKNQEPPPPGPAYLKFVDFEIFAVVCNLVVVLNLAAMVIGPKFESYAITLRALDQLFLAWYVVELCARALFYQRFLIFGKISVVWWNWLDLGIVVSGVIDQWLLPMLMAMNGDQLDIDTSALRGLRLLRLFRIMRFLRIIKAFLKSDFAWAEGAVFEIWMAGVIAFNSVMMAFETDIPWAGWLYVENFLQTVYTFELGLRLKRQRCMFFMDMDNVVWNYLDFVMVGGGALDLWLVPLIHMLQELFLGSREIQGSTSLSGFLRLLKIMRILRVLRLVRLLRMVKPLYRLLIGVIASVKAMQWVLALTLLTLYACAIVFTSLVGKGLMSTDAVSDSADEFFGSVPKSMFSLFKLMNGEMTVVAPITGSITGQLLFAGFMVVSNWAILAILTAVVSDNMISTSQQANEEDEHRKNESDHQKRIRRLTALFSEIDRDGRGTISTLEWQKMLEDRSLHQELCDATGLHIDDLNDYFECLAKDRKQQERDKQLRASLYASELHLDYRSFMEALKDEGVLADKRSILHVMKQLRLLDSQMKREFEEFGKFSTSGRRTNNAFAP